MMLYLKYFLGGSFILTPLPILTVFFLLAGIIFLFIGILAQLIINQQEERENMKNAIKEKMHFKKN
tara:strand:- start:1179 stop:1376 length:198 start_codon:yes stop_codon:yes gene_type:complete